MENVEKYYEYMDGLLEIYCTAKDSVRQIYFIEKLQVKIPLPPYHYLSAELKLENDKYTEMLPSKTKIATINGIIFNASGGYSQQNNSLKKAEQIRSLERFVLAGGALFAGIYSLAKLVAHRSEIWNFFFGC